MKRSTLQILITVGIALGGVAFLAFQSSGDVAGFRRLVAGGEHALGLGRQIEQVSLWATDWSGRSEAIVAAVVVCVRQPKV